MARSNIGSAVYALDTLLRIKERQGKQQEDEFKWTIGKLIEQDNRATDLPTKQAIYDTLLSVYQSAPAPLKKAVEPLIKMSPISEPNRMKKMYLETNPAPRITADPEVEPQLYGEQKLAAKLHQMKMNTFAGLPAEKTPIERFTSGGQDMIAYYSATGVPIIQTYDKARITEQGAKYNMTPEEIEANGWKIVTNEQFTEGDLGGGRQRILWRMGYNAITNEKFTEAIPTGIMIPGSGGPDYDPMLGRIRDVPSAMQERFLKMVSNDKKDPWVKYSREKLEQFTDSTKGMSKEQATQQVRARWGAWLSQNMRDAAEGHRWNFIMRDMGHVAGLNLDAAIFDKLKWWSDGKQEIIAIPGRPMDVQVGDSILRFYIDVSEGFNQVYNRDGVPLGSLAKFQADLERRVGDGTVKGVAPNAVVPKIDQRQPGQAPPAPAPAAPAPAASVEPKTYPGVPIVKRPVIPEGWPPRKQMRPAPSPPSMQIFPRR